MQQLTRTMASNSSINSNSSGSQAPNPPPRTYSRPVQPPPPPPLPSVPPVPPTRESSIAICKLTIIETLHLFSMSKVSQNLTTKTFPLLVLDATFEFVTKQPRQLLVSTHPTLYQQQQQPRLRIRTNIIITTKISRRHRPSSQV